MRQYVLQYPFENAVDLPENPDDLTDEHIDAICGSRESQLAIARRIVALCETTCEASIEAPAHERNGEVA